MGGAQEPAPLELGRAGHGRTVAGELCSLRRRRKRLRQSHGHARWYLYDHGRRYVRIPDAIDNIYPDGAVDQSGFGTRDSGIGTRHFEPRIPSPESRTPDL